MSGLESVAPRLEAFSSLKSCMQSCFLGLQRGRHLCEMEVGEKCSKRNSQPALISCKNTEECGATSAGNLS